MEALIGFLIALAIGLTGVGGGVITAPVLILFLGLSPAQAVGTALAFSALVKLPAVLVYLYNQHVNFRVLAFMLVGGLPGVAAGALFLNRLEEEGLKSLVLATVGLIVIASAVLNLLRLRMPTAVQPSSDRSHLLPWLALPIGLEVGFSSAGAGALGTLALFTFTPLLPIQVVGTDLLFGMALSTVGGGLHLVTGNWDSLLFLKLVSGGLGGALLGAHLGAVVPTRILRIGLLLWLVIMGSLLLNRGLGA